MSTNSIIKSPLEGIKVLELASWVAIPAAAAILGDWGADVIKIENIQGGDPLRGLRDENLESDINIWWEQSNRNKRSAAIDISKEQGKKIFYELIKDTDVFLTNIPIRSIKKLGVTYENLTELNSRIIYLSFTGFGTLGPDANKQGFDVTAFWARSGLMHRVGEPGRVPPQMPAAMGDLTAALCIAGAVSTALFTREKTGMGEKVDISLCSVSAWVMAWEILVALTQGKETAYKYQDKARNPLFNVYQTKDGRWIQLACLTSDLYWDEFCRAIGREELINNQMFNSDLEREKNKEVLIAIIRRVFSSKTLNEWEEILRRHGIVYEKVRHVTEWVTDAQAKENHFFVQMVHPIKGHMPLVNSPVNFTNTISSVRIAAPLYGQHTEDILLQLGYSWEEILDLKIEGVII